MLRLRAAPHHSGHQQTHALTQSLTSDTRAVHSTSTCRTRDCKCVRSQCSCLSSTSPTTVPAGASLREVISGRAGRAKCVETPCSAPHTKRTPLWTPADAHTHAVSLSLSLTLSHSLSLSLSRSLALSLSLTLSYSLYLSLSLCFPLP